jgi:hypothetical protein
MAKTTRIAVLLDDQDLEKLTRVLRPGEPMSSAFRRLLHEAAAKHSSTGN